MQKTYRFDRIREMQEIVTVLFASSQTPDCSDTDSSAVEPSNRPSRVASAAVFSFVRVPTMLRMLFLAIGSVVALALVAIILLVSLSLDRQK